jgi:hypothetical protein
MNPLTPVFKSLRRQGVLAVQKANPKYSSTVINRMYTERPTDWRRGGTRPGFYLGAVWAYPADLKQRHPIIRYAGGGQHPLKSNRLTTLEVGALLEKELFQGGLEVLANHCGADEPAYIELVYPVETT